MHVPASHSSDNELDIVHITSKPCDKCANILDYSVVSYSKDTSASHSCGNELDPVSVTSNHRDRIVNELDSNCSSAISVDRERQVLRRFQLNFMYQDENDQDRPFRY